MTLKYLFIVLVFCAACSHSETTADTTSPPATIASGDSIDKKTLEKKMESSQCFDPNELTANNIEFRKLEDDVWFLKYEDTTEMTAQVQGCTYYGILECNDGYFINVDSMRVQFEGKSQLIAIDYMPNYGFRAENFNRLDIGFDDCNFDKIEDLVVGTFYGAAGKNIYHQFYLYHSESGYFEYSENLSDLSNPEFDDSTKTVSSGWYGGMGGQVHYGGVYCFEEDSLLALSSVIQDYDRENDQFFEITFSRNADGTIDSVFNVIKEEDFY